MDGQDAERSAKSLRCKAWRGYRSLAALVDDLIWLSVDNSLVSIEIVSEGWRILLCGTEWEDDQ